MRHRALLIEHDSVDGGFLRLADAERVDLIVLGTHRRNNLADRLLGVVTDKVSQRTRRPMAIVPADWGGSV